MTEKYNFTTAHHGNRVDWLRDRKHGIGASEAAQLVTINGLPVSNWGSPYSVFVDKTTDKIEEETTERQLIWGTVLEPGIRKTVAKRLDCAIHHDGPFTICWKDAMEGYPRFQFATLDGIIFEANDAVIEEFGDFNAGDASVVSAGPGVVEIKSDARPVWTSPPLNYVCQVQHQLSVTGWKWGLLCVFFSLTQEIVIYPILRDDKLLRSINRTELQFWMNHVISGVAPPADGSDATRRALAEFYDHPNDEVVDLPDRFASLVDSRTDLKEEIRAAQGSVDGIDNLIKAAMGNATIGIFPDGKRVTWKEQTRKEHVVAASTFRVLRFAKK